MTHSVTRPSLVIDRLISISLTPLCFFLAVDGFDEPQRLVFTHFWFTNKKTSAIKRYDTRVHSCPVIDQSRERNDVLLRSPAGGSHIVPTSRIVYNFWDGFDIKFAKILRTPDLLPEKKHLCSNLSFWLRVAKYM